MSVWVEMIYSLILPIAYLSHAPRERVSWNAYIRRYDEEIMRHAPRERVSWNNQDSRGERVAYVTLHVSVWVEIIVLGLAKFKSMSRSTWACELKFDKSDSFINDTKSHAPRERVSWNAFFTIFVLPVACHAPRERVSWNSRINQLQKT